MIRILLALTTIAVAALLSVPAANADRGGIPHKKTAPTVGATFNCSLIVPLGSDQCIYTAPGLAPSTLYQASIAYLGSDGHGCNLGFGGTGLHSDANGTFTFGLDIEQLTCGHNNLPGSVTAWARTGDAWNDPAVPGSLVTASVP